MIRINYEENSISEIVKKTINKKKEQEKIDTEIRKIMNQYLTVKI